MIACCFIVNHREIGTAKALATWIKELGGVKNHEAILCITRPAQRIGAEDQILPILREAFGTVSTFVPRDEVEIPWPNDKNDASSPNHMFRRVSEEMEWIRKKPFLWLEMDAIPTKANWMDELDREYEKGAKPFMGVRLEVRGAPYMSGVAVYPANITVCTSLLRNCGQNPFDVFSGRDTVRMAHFTDLIQYVKPNEHGVADWSVHKEGILPNTVLYHRSKDLSLIDNLRGSSTVPDEVIDNPKIYRDAVDRPNLSLPKERDLEVNPPSDIDALIQYHAGALDALASAFNCRDRITDALAGNFLLKRELSVIAPGTNHAADDKRQKKLAALAKGRAKLAEKRRLKKKAA